MDKIFISIERVLGNTMVAAGAVAVVLGLIYMAWHMWVIGAMFISLGKQLKKA